MKELNQAVKLKSELNIQQNQDLRLCIFWEHLGEKLLKKVYKFINFIAFGGKKLRLLSAIFSAGLSKLYFTCPGEQFGRKNLKKHKTILFRILSEKHSAGFSKLHSPCPEEIFEKIYQKLIIFLDFERNIFCLWAKIFRQGCQN